MSHDKFSHEIYMGKNFLAGLENYLESDPVKNMEHYKDLYFKEQRLFKEFQVEKEIEFSKLELEIARLGLELGKYYAKEDDND